VWITIADLVRETLSPAQQIDADAARTVVMGAIGVGRVLVSGGHLADGRLVLAAGPLRLEITVVSGTAAIDTQENLNVVPGAASADDWTLHLPAPELIATWVADAVAGSDHLSDEPAPAETSARTAVAASESGIDAAALSRLLDGGS
jgi:hypothetical protein